MTVKLRTVRIFKAAFVCLVLVFGILLCSLFLDQPTAVYFYGSFSKDAKTYLERSPLVLPSNICREDTLLTAFVTSEPSHLKLREAVRETWGSVNNLSGFRIKTYFVLGTTSNEKITEEVREECRKYDDIILEDFVDSYYNLTIKSFMILKTVNKYCLDSARFILKADDDVFVNFPLLIENLAPYMESDYLFMGSKFSDGTVDRKPWSKWYAPKHIHPENKYPPMLYGSAYLFSANLVPKLLEAALDLPLYHLEDVYITGFLSNKLGITLTHNPHIQRLKVQSTPCAYVNLTTTHYNVAEDYKKLFDMIYHGDDLEKQCSDYKSKLTFSFLI